LYKNSSINERKIRQRVGGFQYQIEISHSRMIAAQMMPATAMYQRSPERKPTGSFLLCI